MTGDKVLDLVHLFLGEVAVYLHLRDLFRLVIEVAYWDPCNLLVTYLGVVHQKRELSLQNKSNWVLG